MLLSGKIFGVTTVVAYVDTDGGFYSYVDLLNKREVSDKFPNLLLTSGDLSVPYLVDETSQSFDQVFNIFLTNRDSINEGVLSSIKSTLDPQINLPLDTYKNLFECTLSLEDYLSGNSILPIDFPIDKYKNFGNTKKLVDALNSQYGTKSVVANNNTLFRKLPGDELFVTVPTADSLAFFPPSNFIPVLSDVFIPYKDVKLKGVDYKRFLDATGTNIEEVEGSSDNVTSELYDEEVRFYEALCELHKSLLQIEYPNQSIEDCITYKVSSTTFKQYITEFMLKVLSYHWNHNGMLPVSFDADDPDIDDDSDSDTGSSDSASSNKLFNASVADLSDGEMIISGVINSEFTKDIFFPIRLLIQALRFGDKKPSKLKLFDDKSYFDLNGFVYTTTSGSYNSYEVKLTESGCIYTPVRLITTNNRIFDSRFISTHNIVKPIIDVPVGLLCKKEFKGTDEFQLCIINLVDLIANYGKDPNLSIEGITLVDSHIQFNDKFNSEIFNLDLSISLNEVLNNLKNSSDGFYTSYVAPSVKETFLDFNSYNSKLCALGIYNGFIEKDDLVKQEILSCISAEELKLKCSDYRIAPVNLLNITLGLSYCKMFSKANDKYAQLQETTINISLSDILSIYLNTMKEQEFYGNVFFTETLVPETKSEMKSSNVFGGGTQVETKPVNPPSEDTKPESNNSTSIVNPFSRLFEDKKFDSLVNIIMTHSEIERVNEGLEKSKSPLRVKEVGNFSTNVVVGYMGIDENKHFYFLDPDQAGTPSNKSYQLSKFKPQMVALLRVLVNDRPLKVKFQNQEVFNYYASIVEKI